MPPLPSVLPRAHPAEHTLSSPSILPRLISSTWIRTSINSLPPPMKSLRTMTLPSSDETSDSSAASEEDMPQNFPGEDDSLFDEGDCEDYKEPHYMEIGEEDPSSILVQRGTQFSSVHSRVVERVLSNRANDTFVPVQVIRADKSLPIAISRVVHDRELFVLKTLRGVVGVPRLKSHQRIAQGQYVVLTSHPGHNKWSKIRDKKGANDANRGATINRAVLDIINASRIGGSTDPDNNASLAAVLKRLKAQNIPKENIAKALAKANKTKNSGETTVYEAIAFNSVGIIIECSTDNANRTVQTLREILTARGARIAPVGFMFQRNGRVKVLLEKNAQFDETLEKVVEVAIENGSEDFETCSVGENQEEVEFTCESTALSSLTTALSEAKLCQVVASELVYRPLTPAEISEEDSEKADELVQALEGNDDTMRVWTNLPE
ncbi:hypothetical protein V5O48_009332 [Marasmius crinis-equi]|uniref:Uncharacterized protein n=1 Tax=Marasmius crinis-equi TaxID=585013 RepID=A0ABR3FBH8_9AGAR